MFIAPRGALQFEIKSRADGNPWIGRQHAIWVMPRRRSPLRLRPCAGKCSEAYPVILKALPPKKQKQCEDSMRKTGANCITVCDCMGRIIE